MGKGGYSDPTLDSQCHSWDEVKKHTTKDDKWIVIDGHIYDVSRWQRKHPGGARILSHFAGQDATEVWHAMHNDKDHVAKYMKPLMVGKIEHTLTKKDAINQDFRELRKKVEEMGMFKADPWFFAAHLAHIILLEVLAYNVLVYCGTGWLPLLAVSIILTTSQAQAGWSQHDYGHLSVCNSFRLNHLMHHFVIGHLKGASSHWWNFRHNQHHAKPNALGMDPDVNTAALFMLGTKIPVQWGKAKRGYMPYQWQHDYFWILGPPILLPVYFHLENIYFVFKRRDWMDLLWISTFFARFFYFYGPLLGGWGAFGLYMFVRFLESHWFTFVTQMNHIVMEIDKDQQYDWVTAQTRSTCNIAGSLFNDWFTGHLNFQIEHHFFPTMPRHNYSKVAPLCESLCKKHGLQYIVKPLGTACVDIIRSLKKSGQLWYDAYYHV